MRSKFLVKRKVIDILLLPFLFSLTFTLILFNKTDYYLVDKVKSYSLDYISPVTKIISLPVNTIADIGKRFNNINNLEIENLKLKEEIIRLKKWQILAIKNSRENRVFKSLLNSTSNNVEIIKTASVINQSYDIYTKLVIINAGKNFNVIKDMAVINDPTSSIPVKTLSDNNFSILKGTSNGKFLKSTFIKGKNLPRVGDLLVTSGNAKIFPRDILVAKVIKVNEDNFIALPYVDFNNLSYVQVVKSK